MEKKLKGKRVAFLLTDGFEESEFSRPFAAVRDSGAIAEVISLKPGKIKGWKNKAKNNQVPLFQQRRSIDRRFFYTYPSPVTFGFLNNIKE